MHIKKAELETVCGVTSVLPKNTQPEFAFVGRSNVGKSSLLNTLVHRKALARTSSQPGKTQTINFFHLNDLFYFVDLPGYGYAKVNKELKVKWGRMMDRYLSGSRQLRIVFLLVDIRHEPSENDKEMYQKICRLGRKTVVIATKEDKIKRSQKDKQLKVLRQGLGLGTGEPILPVSSVTKNGYEAIWEVIAQELSTEDETSLVQGDGECDEKSDLGREVDDNKE